MNVLAPILSEIHLGAFMQKIFGTILFDNDAEILDDDRPENGNFKDLQSSIFECQRRLKQNPNIKQINIYTLKQSGQRILDYTLYQDAGPQRNEN